MKQVKTKSITLAAIAIMALSGCREHIDEGARYTFTGHTIASFLEENEEIYSSFIDILDRGGRLNLMTLLPAISTNRTLSIVPHW